MPLDRLRQWLGWRARPVAKAAPRPVAPPASAEQQAAFDRLLAELRSRMPEDLRPAFEAALDRLPDGALTGPALLDAIDEARTGLGIAMGRSDARREAELKPEYQRLGDLLAWLFEALGQPPDTRYAVGLRALAAWQAREAAARDPGNP